MHVNCRADPVKVTKVKDFLTKTVAGNHRPPNKKPKETPETAGFHADPTINRGGILEETCVDTTTPDVHNKVYGIDTKPRYMEPCVLAI